MVPWSEGRWCPGLGAGGAEWKPFSGLFISAGGAELESGFPGLFIPAGGAELESDFPGPSPRGYSVYWLAVLYRLLPVFQDT